MELALEVWVSMIAGELILASAHSSIRWPGQSSVGESEGEPGGWPAQLPSRVLNWPTEVEVSGYVKRCKLMWCFAEARAMGRHVMLGKCINRTQWTVVGHVHS